MTLKKSAYISAYLILPVLMFSISSWLYSPTRTYIHSAEFILSLFLGALVTSAYYAHYLSSIPLRYTFISIFGLLIPLLHLYSTQCLFGSTVQHKSELCSTIFVTTTLVGLTELVLYLGIFYMSYIKLRKSMVQRFYNFVFKEKQDDF